MSESPLRGLFGTLLAAAACGAAFWATLAVGGDAGVWFPPAVAVVGVGCAAGRGAVGGAAVAALAGLLHGAATGSPVGACVAATAAVARVLGSLNLAPARRWAAAGVLGWGVAAAVAAVAGSDGMNLRSFPAAIVLGLLCGGVAAAVRFGDAGDRGWG